MAAGGVAHLCIDAVVLGKCLAVWTSETVISSPAISLVLHQKDEATASVSKVAKARFRILVFTSPPGKQVTAKR